LALRDRVFGVLSKKRSPKPAQLTPVAGNISGRWDLDVEFFSSKSQHSLFVEQEGNRIQGSHKGDFSVRDMYGTIEGDQVTLHSTSSEHGTGDSITFIFQASSPMTPSRA
jgi:hypothetical protein